jgi:hypothetical protein
MPSSTVTLALVAAATAADGAGAHGLASWLVLVAIPVAAAVAFAAAGDLVEEKRSLFSTLCPALVLVLLVLASAVRSNATVGAPVPRLTLSALGACLVLYVVQVFAAVVRTPRPQPIARDGG